MKINCCKNDLTVLLLLDVPLCFGAVIWLCYEMDCTFVSLIACPALLLLISLLFLQDFLYFSRTIFLKKDGITISIWKYQRHYLWSDLTVSYCQNDHGISVDDWPKPGLLITAIPFRKKGLFTAQTACIFLHPLRSVFLRFQSDDTNYMTGKQVLTGYVIEKDKLIHFLTDNHVSIQNP